MRTKSLLYLVIILVITLLLSSFGIANGHGPTDSPPDAGEAPVAPPPKEKTFTDLTAAEQHQALKENPNFFIENPEFAKDYYANLDNVGKVPEADAKFFAEGSNAVDNLEAATKFFQTADVKHIREAKDGAKQVFEKIYPGITFNLGVIEDDFKWNANEGTLFNGEKKFGGLNTLKDPDSTLPPQDKVVGIEAIKDGIIITYADGQKITIDGTGEVAVNLGQLGLEVFKDDNYYTLVHGEGASINVDGNKLTFTNFKSGSGHNLGRDYHFTGDLVVTPDTISSDNGEIKFNEYTINGAFEIKVNTNEINIWDSNGPTTFVHTDPKYRIPGHEGNMLMVKSGGQTKAERLTIHLEGIPDKIGEVQGEHVYLGIAEDGVNPIAALKGRGSIIPVQQTEGGIASLVDRSILTGKNNDAFVQVGYLVDKESLTGGGQVRISRGDQSIDFSNNNVRFEKTSSPNAEVLELSCKECNGQIGTVEKSVIANNEFLRIPAKLIADGTTVKAVIDPRYAGKLQGEVIGDNLVIFGEGENGQGVSLINGAVVRQRGAARTQQVGVAQQAGRVQLTTEQQEKVSEFERLRNARNIEGMKELASQMDPNLRRYLSSTTGINLDALSIPAYAEKITQYFNEIDKPRLGVIAWAKSVQRRMARKGIQLEFNENGDCTTEGCGQILQTEFNKRNANSHHIIKLYQSQALRDLALAEGAAALASSQPGGPGAAAVPGAPQPAAGRVKELQDRIAALRATKNNWNARYRITLENRRIARENAEIERQRVEAAVQMAENEALAAPLKDPESGMTETEKASYRARKAEAAALAQQRASDRDMVNQLSQSQTAIRNNRDRYQRQLNKANRERFTDNDQPERDLTTARNALRETNSALRAANRRVAAADARIAQLAEQETNPRARGHIYSAAGNEGEAAKAYQEASNALAELGQRDEGLQRNLFAASHRSVDPNSAGAAAQYEHAASVAATIEDEGVRAISAATIRHHTQVKPVMNAYIDSVNDVA